MNKINWKLRFKNKATLTSLIVLIVSFVYKILDLIGVVPPIPQENLLKVLLLIIDVLAAIGILVDPTTSGISDSARAMTYASPYKPGDEVGMTETTVYVSTPGVIDIEDIPKEDKSEEIK